MGSNGDKGVNNGDEVDNYGDRRCNNGAGTMTLTLFALFALAVVASATIEVNHLIQKDDAGHVVHIDVIRDQDAKLVMAIIGDVSHIRGKKQTVNLHDYNTGYGVLKNINRKICILTRPLVPMQPSWKYEQGTTYEVNVHYMRINSKKMSNEEVLELAGSNIATFCNDYSTYYAEATPGDKRDKTGALRPEGETEGNWCIFESCIFSADAYAQLE